MDLFQKKMSLAKLQLQSLKTSTEYVNIFNANGERSASNAHMKIVSKNIQELQNSLQTLERLHVAELKRKAVNRVQICPVQSMIVNEKTSKAEAVDTWQDHDEDDQVLVQSLSIHEEVSQCLNVFRFTKIKLKILHAPYYETKQVVL